MSVSERTSLWLAVILTPLLFVYTTSRLDSKLVFFKSQVTGVQKNTIEYIDETKEALESNAQKTYTTVQVLLADLFAGEAVCLERSTRLEESCSSLALQLFSVEQTLAFLSESTEAGGKSLELTQEQLSLVRDSLTKVQQELQEKEDLAEKVKHYLDTQVRVVSEGGKGSGTLLAGGYVLSAAHVVDGAGHLVVELGAKVFPAKVIKKSADYDLALLKVETAEKLPYVKLKGAASKDFPLLSDVYVVGFPLGVGPFFTTGQLCGKNETQDSVTDAWLLNANVFFGSSGGGVFDPATGELVGVVVAMHARGGMGVSFMSCVIPGHRVAEWLEKTGVKVEWVCP